VSLLACPCWCVCVTTLLCLYWCVPPRVPLLVCLCNNTAVFIGVSSLVSLYCCIYSHDLIGVSLLLCHYLCPYCCPYWCVLTGAIQLVCRYWCVLTGMSLLVRPNWCVLGVSLLGYPNWCVFTGLSQLVCPCCFPNPCNLPLVPSTHATAAVFPPIGVFALLRGILSPDSIHDAMSG
jgi:hypothetical protein